MSLEKLTFESLADLDNGRVRAAFDHALSEVQRDLADRPVDKRPRKVTLTLELKPVPAETGELHSAQVSAHLDYKIPKRRTRDYDMRSIGGGLVFNEMSPDDVRQTTIDQGNRPRSVSDVG